MEPVYEGTGQEDCSSPEKREDMAGAIPTPVQDSENWECSFDDELLHRGKCKQKPRLTRSQKHESKQQKGHLHPLEMSGEELARLQEADDSLSEIRKAVKKVLMHAFRA